MSGPWASMTEDVLPYEVKRLIFDCVDLQTLKQLRLASHSWAAVGTELLLLPTLFVKSYSVDIPRLTSIGNSPTVSQHAATTVKSVVFQSLDWDPVILRKILTSRHEARVIWETADFVPTMEEQEALDELDVMIKQRGEDQILRKYSKDSLTRVLELLPRVNAVRIVCENVFKSRLLRKVFDEFSLETYRPSEHQSQEVLSAAQDAGQTIKHFTHEQLLPIFFEWHSTLVLNEMVTSMQHLESLHLTISNVREAFDPDDNGLLHLGSLISSLPRLRDLSVKFETLRPIPLVFLPQTPLPNLHTVSLYSILLEPDKFFPFLKRQAETLKRLHISSTEIPEGQGSWSSCLARIKENAGPKLEKFQLSRMLKSHDDDETWFFGPIYTDDWEVAKNETFFVTNRWRKDIEDYVLRDGPWPIVEEDNVSHMFS